MTSKEFQFLPLGTSTFTALRADNEIYVDKTDLIYNLCKRRNKIFISRPRRFGKSLLTSTFESLFKNGSQDFKGLSIEKLWNFPTYKVVRLDFSLMREISSAEEFQRQFVCYVIKSFELIGLPSNSDFTALIQWLSHQPVNSIVLLIDEYDAPLTACLDKPELFKEVQRILGQFYAILKSQEGCLRFLFVTGVTKFTNTGLHSGFNNLNDISLSSEYATLLGYTEEEILHYFAPYITQSAEVLNCTEAEIMLQLQKHYNGFCFDEEATKKVYCPWSILNFFNSPRRGFLNYWYMSGGQPNVLKKYLLTHTLEKPQDLEKLMSAWSDELNTSQTYNDLDLKALLFQTGYLTIKGVQDRTKFVLGFPNEEVTTSLGRLYSDELLGGNVFIRKNAPSLMQLLTTGEPDEVVQCFNQVFNAIDYQKYPIKDEATCRGYLQVLMVGADIVPDIEHHSALGRSDIELSLGDRRWVFEIKFAQKAADESKLLAEGIAQIKARKYGETPSGNRNLRLIRMTLVFSSEKRQFTRWAQA